MGQYRIGFYFHPRVFGFAIDWQRGNIIYLILPFLTIPFGLDKHAHGIRFFKD